MADLLECLVQIRALGETSGRLARLAGAYHGDAWRRLAVPPGEWSAMEVLVRMIREEEALGSTLRVVLADAAADFPSQKSSGYVFSHRPEDWSLVQTLEHFAARRRDTLEILVACSAEQLSRNTPDPVRGDLEVADLVALALARDIDSLGQIRECLLPTVTASPNHGEP